MSTQSPAPQPRRATLSPQLRPRRALARAISDRSASSAGSIRYATVTAVAADGSLTVDIGTPVPGVAHVRSYNDAKAGDIALVAVIHGQLTALGAL